MNAKQEKSVLWGALILCALFLSYVLTPSFTAVKNPKAILIDNPYPYPVEQWQKLGSANMERMDYKKLRQVFIKLTPTQASGGSVDISALGFTMIITKQISAQRNNTNAYDVPQVSFKTVSNTSVSYNIVQGSNTLVSVLGLNVLQGPSTVFATDLSNIEINIMITGY